MSGGQAAGPRVGPEGGGERRREAERSESDNKVRFGQSTGNGMPHRQCDIVGLAWMELGNLATDWLARLFPPFRLPETNGILYDVE